MNASESIKLKETNQNNNSVQNVTKGNQGMQNSIAQCNQMRGKMTLATK